MTMTVIPPYDPAALDESTRAYLNGQEALIKKLLRGTARNILDIGQALNDAKARAGHGQFESWLRDRFDWTQRTAERYMAVAKIDNLSLLEHADPSALYLLAAPSTPEEVIAAMKTKAEAGESVKHAEVKAAIEDTKTPTSQDATLLYQHFAGQTVGMAEICAQVNLETSRRVKAFMLLRTDGRATEVEGKPGHFKFAPLPAPEPTPELIPGTAALMATLPTPTPVAATPPASEPQGYMRSCEVCGGTGTATNRNGYLVPCGACDGTGIYPAPAEADEKPVPPAPDPNVAAAYALRSRLELAALALRDAAREIKTIRSIRSLHILPGEQLFSTADLLLETLTELNELDTHHTEKHLVELRGYLVGMARSGQPYGDEPLAAEPAAGESPAPLPSETPEAEKGAEV